MDQNQAYEEDLEALAAEKLVGRLAEKYGVKPRPLLNTLRDTVFSVRKDELPLSVTEIAAVLTICERYELDPLAKEIYATRNPKNKLLLIMVAIDGYVKIANREKNYDGCAFTTEMGPDGVAISITCAVQMKNRALPIVITEYMKECRRSDAATPWSTHPNRMLRHKAFRECIRLAIGLSGLTDEDDLEQITGQVDTSIIEETSTKPKAQYLEAPNELDETKQIRKKPGKMATGETLEKNKALEADLNKRMKSQTVEPKDAEWVEPKKEAAPVADFASLWKRWVELRPKLSDAAVTAARAAGGVEFVNERTTPEALALIVAKAEEYL